MCLWWLVGYQNHGPPKHAGCIEFVKPRSSSNNSPRENIGTTRSAVARPLHLPHGPEAIVCDEASAVLHLSLGQMSLDVQSCRFRTATSSSLMAQRPTAFSWSLPLPSPLGSVNWCSIAHSLFVPVPPPVSNYCTHYIYLILCSPWPFQVLCFCGQHYSRPFCRLLWFVEVFLWVLSTLARAPCEKA